MPIKLSGKIAVLFISLLASTICFSQSVMVLDTDAIFSIAPFASCHASTLVELPGNRIMSAWFGGDHEGANNVSIWMSVLTNKQWSAPVEIASGKQNDSQQLPCWNPVLFRTRNGTLFLFYKVGSSPRAWWGEMKTSADDGLHWSAAQKLPGGFLGPIKNKPVQLPNSDLLCPSSTETDANQWNIHLERCDSSGHNWRKIAVDCDTFSVIQPSILQYKNGNMQLLCRSRQNVIAQSWSQDGGNTWQRVTATNLPNPNSGSDAVSLSNGYQLLVYNPLTAGKKWWEGRSVLKLACSTDGQNWKDLLTLEDHADGEYSYPAIIQTSDGTIYISYTAERKKIKYTRLKFIAGDE